jgi:hypothetical protein
MKTNRILVLTGASMLILGARLPWMSVPVLFGLEGPAYEAIEIGWEDNGFFTGGIGIILLLLWISRKESRRVWFSMPGAILAACAVLVVVGCFQRILEIDPQAGFFAAADIGLYITLVGSVLALIGAGGAAGTNEGQHNLLDFSRGVRIIRLVHRIRKLIYALDDKGYDYGKPGAISDTEGRQ